MSPGPVRTRWPLLSQVALPTGILLLYFAFPTDATVFDRGLAVSLGLSMLGVAIVTVTIAREFRRELSGAGNQLSGRHVMVLFEFAILAFAFSYLVLDRNQPDQLVGLETRLDALYFAATTMTTVGFGDIHAAGQIARALVLLQLVFDVVVLALIARIVNHRLDTRSRSLGLPD